MTEDGYDLRTQQKAAVCLV